MDAFLLLSYKSFVVSIWSAKTGSVGHRFASERHSWGRTLDFRLWSRFHWVILSLASFPANNRRSQHAAFTVTHTENVRKITLLTYCVRKKRNETEVVFLMVKEAAFFLLWIERTCATLLSQSPSKSLSVSSSSLPFCLLLETFTLQAHYNHNIQFSMCKSGN